MGILDYVLIALFLLFFASGCIKGFSKMIYKLIVLVGSVTVAIFVARPLAGLLANTAVGSFFTGLFGGLFENNQYVEAAVFLQGGIFMVAPGVSAEAALGSFLLPKFMKKAVLGSLAEGAILGEAVSAQFSLYFLTAISAIILAILVMVIIAMLRFVIMGKRKKKEKSVLNRLMGGVLNLVYGFMFVTICFAILKMLERFSFMESINSYISKNTISTWFYENNWLAKIYDAILSLFASTSAAQAAIITQSLPQLLY